jgi:hypothetical protein
MKPTAGMLALAKSVAEDDGHPPNSSEDGGSASLAREIALSDCGTGAGGFKTGNTCKEIEPYKYEVPAAGKIAIYAALMPGVGLSVNGTKDPAGWSINDDAIRNFGGSQEKIDNAHAMLAKFRTGERFVDAAEFPNYIGYDDAARMAVAGMPIPGAALDGMAKVRGTTREELEKALGVRQYEPTASAK